MLVTSTTTAEKIANEFAHPMGEDIRKRLAAAIETFADMKVAERETQVRKEFDKNHETPDELASRLGFPPSSLM